MNSTSATGHAGPQRHGHAVAGGLGRVGGDREELAGAAGGEQHVRRPAPRGASPSGSRATTPRHRPSSTRRSRANQRSEHRRRGRPAPPPPAPARSRRRWPRPPACTTRAMEWPPSRASSRPPSGSRSNTAPRAISSLHPARALVDQHPHGVDVAQAGAGGQRVGQVEVGRVRRSPPSTRGHAALGPAGGRLVAARPW